MIILTSIIFSLFLVGFIGGSVSSTWRDTETVIYSTDHRELNNGTTEGTVRSVSG